jgi:hypothetical protein
MNTVFAILFVIIGADTSSGFNQFQVVADPIQMTADECFLLAREVNSDASTPYLLVCAPKLSGDIQS